MTLPDDFQFSQASLQDYVDCPRRFQLRRLLRRAWPAAEAEPIMENERYLRQGAAFHRMLHQHTLGLTLEQLSSVALDEALLRWWRNYVENGPTDLPPSRRAEFALSAPLGDYRLTAKYDLVAVDAERQPAVKRRGVIVDWKTSRRRPGRKWLAERLQTRVYPYLLVRAGRDLNEGKSFEPEQVEMVYWFANFPLSPERFSYDAAQYEKDAQYLAALIAEIEGLDEDEDWPLATRQKLCNYCPYRSLCRRGRQAGAFDEMEEETETDDGFDFVLNFEQIAEIEY